MWIKAEDGTLVNMDRVDVVVCRDLTHVRPNSLTEKGTPTHSLITRASERDAQRVATFDTEAEAKTALSALGVLLGAAEIPTLAEEPEAAEVLQTSAKAEWSKETMNAMNALQTALNIYGDIPRSSSNEDGAMRDVCYWSYRFLYELRKDTGK